MGNKLPENLTLLHDGEEQVWKKSKDFIEASDDLGIHVRVLHSNMDSLQFIRMNFECETEDQLIVMLLGARLFNDAGAAIRLIFGGYYQAAGMSIRDALETGFLLDYFSIDPSSVQRWKAADEKDRQREFAPAKIRTALDERDKFTEKRRHEHYKLLSVMTGHPTFQGLVLLRPSPEADAHMGPFFVPTLLRATIQECVKSLIVAFGNFQHFFLPKTLPQLRAALAHEKVAAEWAKVIFQREDLTNVRALEQQIAAAEASEYSAGTGTHSK